jgi:D-alanyl-lipoteichoic acid acyltransferase DltB (MBOAT superfamily)
MTFGEPLTLVFVALVAAALRLTGSANRARVGLLAAASLFFYATWNPLYLVPLLATCVVDWSVVRALSRTERPAARRLLVTASLVFDLGVLALFKYGTLLAELAAPRGEAPGWRLVFAAGISFYTFQSLSCVIDVYRREEEPVRSFLDYVAYVSFFPTLLAGPITRAQTFFPQLRAAVGPLGDDAGGRALFLVALGTVKKCVLADTLATGLVDRVFEVPGLYSSAEVAVAILGYAVQIYGDFSGYSDIAVGSALLLGFRLKDNFNAPYRAADLAEFWRRWHISLSTWLRDYLFFSLPGKRPGTPWPYANLVVTFALGGLWHGATYTFGIWGLLHGAGLAAVRFVEARRNRAGRRGAPSGLRRALGVAATFSFVCFAWVFFRCATVGQALELFRVLLQGTGSLANVSPAAAAAIVVGLGSQAVPETFLPALERRFSALPALLQATALLAVAAFVRVAAGQAVAPFIYTRF